MQRSISKDIQSRPRHAAITIWAVCCLALIIGFLAFSLDWGYMVVTESELQNAADAGAFAAARAMCAGRSQAIDAGKLWASKNVAAGQSVTLTNADVELGAWDSQTATFTVIPASSSQSPNAVRVTCRRTADRGNALQLFFGPLIGTGSADLSAQAICTPKLSRCGLIVGLTSVTLSSSSYTDSYNSAKAPYSTGSAGVNGHVCSNGNIFMNGSTEIRGDAHPGPGKSVNNSSTKGILGTISALSTAVSYPTPNPGTAATNNNNSSIPLSQMGRQPLNAQKEFSLSGGDFVTLAPGTYYFSKLTLSGSASFAVSGRTVIYVTGDVDMGGGSVINQTALPRNLEFNVMGSNCVISGSAAFYGVVYAPNATVSRNGSSDYFGSIIAGTLSLSGSGGIHADDSLDTATLSTTRLTNLVQ